MDRSIEWIVRNGAFAVALYFAVVEHVDWLVLGIAAFVWWRLARTVWVIPVPRVARAATAAAVAPPVTLAFDLAALAAMFIAHWYWTAFAYALSCGCVAIAQARAIGKP
jgi:hypothetical protein